MGTEPEVQGGPVGPAPAPAPMPEAGPAPMAEPSGGGMNIMKILAIVGAILLLVSFFLPMVSLSQMGVTASASGFSATKGEMTVGGGIGTVPLTDETGMLQIAYPIFYAVILMGILALLFCFIPKPIMPLLAGIFGLIGLICAFVGYMALQSNMPADISWDMGYGLYIAIVGGILALIGGILTWKKAAAA